MKKNLNDNQIDLSSINKSDRRHLATAKFRRVFTRKTGPNRDDQGKFAQGSGG